MTTDTARLRALALAATPGPWHHSDIPGDLETVWQSSSGGAVAWVNESNETGDHHPYADAAHIAANDPAQVLAMCAEIDALRAVRDAAKSYADAISEYGEWNGMEADRCRISLRAALEAAGGARTERRTGPVDRRSSPGSDLPNVHERRSQHRRSGDYRRRFLEAKP